MPKIKKTHSAGFKFKVALSAIINEKTLAEISLKYKVHCSQISKWKRQLLEHGPQIFEDSLMPSDKKLQQEIEELYKEVGKLSVERDFLKKTLEI